VSTYAAGDSYLFYQPVVNRGVSIRTIEGLFQEREEDGYDNGSLQGLSKDDEEDWNSENTDSHDDIGLQGRSCQVI
jgi:hypothetical protein